MEIIILALIAAVAIYIMAKYFISQFKKGKACDDCDRCGSKESGDSDKAGGAVNS